MPLDPQVKPLVDFFNATAAAAYREIVPQYRELVDAAAVRRAAGQPG